MAYGNVFAVAARCLELANPDGNFSSETKPTLAQVQSWLDDASALMNVEFAKCGFPTPITNTVILTILDPIAEYRAAAEAESIRNIESTSWENASDETKPKHWMDLYTAAMKGLTAERCLALEILGLDRTKDLSDGLHAGGLSQDEKTTHESNTDFLQPRFKTRMFQRDAPRDVV